MGGAAAINQGIFINETAGWFEENFPSGKGFFDEDMIADACT